MGALVVGEHAATGGGLAGVETHSGAVLFVVEVGGEVEFESGLILIGVELSNLPLSTLPVGFAFGVLVSLSVRLVVLGSEGVEVVVVFVGDDDGAQKSESEDLFHLLSL
jgi:hypothetical protein